MKKNFFLMVCSFAFIVNAKAQDKIKLKTGDIIKSRVLGVTNTEVIYYKIFKLKDPKLKLPKADVEYVQYESGKIVYMSAKSPAVKTNTTTTTPKKTNTKKRVVKKKK